MIDAAAARQLEHLLVPVRDIAVVDRLVGAEFFQSFKLLRRARRCYDPRSHKFCELEREDRHTARAKRQHSVATLHIPRNSQSIPRGQRGAWQRGRFFIAQVSGHSHDRILIEGHVFTKNSVVPARADRGSHRFGGRFAFLPARYHCRANAIADLPLRNVRTNLDHLTGTIREGNCRKAHSRVVRALDDHYVAVVQRCSADVDEHLAAADRRRFTLDGRKSIDPELSDLPGLHPFVGATASMTSAREWRRSASPTLRSISFCRLHSTASMFRPTGQS